MRDVPPKELLGSGTATEDGVTILEEVINHECAHVFFEVENTGETNALTDLAVEVKISKDGNWGLLANTYTALTGSLLYTSANVKTLGAGLSAIFAVRTFCAYAVRVVATTGTGVTTPVTVRGIGYV